MRPEYFWIIGFYIDDPHEDGKQAFIVKVRAVGMQHAITKACDLIDDWHHHIGVRYFVHNAGLADDGEFENEIREDPISDPWDFEW